LRPRPGKVSRQVDLLWENRTIGDRVFWLMNGTTHTSSVYLAYVNPIWHIAPKAGAGDFTGRNEDREAGLLFLAKLLRFFA
jgi:hypothetical protein